MIELTVTSIPFILRVIYLRWRGMPITLYNVYWALFLWMGMALVVFFCVFHFHPKSASGVVPFRVVPVVAERGGTVTDIKVAAGDTVKPGDVLFTTDDTTEQAAVDAAKAKVAEIESSVASAEAAVHSAEATLHQAEAGLQQALDTLEDQEGLKERKSTAFRPADYERALNQKNSREAQVAAAQAALDGANVELNQVLPATKASAEAALHQAEVDLDQTVVRSRVDGTVEQLTLTVGARAGQTAMAPALLIVPDQPIEIGAGFSQTARAVLHVGMAAELACYSSFNVAMTDSILPLRVTRIQNVVSAGQVVPSGKLLDPSQRQRAGEIFVHFALEYPEQAKTIIDGANCYVQTYTTQLPGEWAHSFVGHVIPTLGVIKAIGLRLKAWVALLTGSGLGGGGH